MKIPRLTLVTLGVADLQKATEFYRKVMEVEPNTSFAGVAFVQLPGTWLSLYPLTELAKDISPEIPATRGGFSGVTLAHNCRSREDVALVVENARAAGARILKEPQDTFWGGFSGYFADPDGYCWEIAWGPMFEFTECGDMRFGEG